MIWFIYLFDVVANPAIHQRSTVKRQLFGIAALEWSSKFRLSLRYGELICERVKWTQWMFEHK